MKTIIFSLLLALSFKPFSCSKSQNTVPSSEIIGTWSGTYTVDQLPDNAPMKYRFVIGENGKLFTAGFGADGREYYHEGTWKMKGNTFTATYTTTNRYWSTVTQSAKMTYVNGRFVDATWTDVKNPDGHLDGKFQNLTRENSVAANSSLY
ncbi:MAG: hypothetical protein DI535_00605 [Citrobacter freundii]|nr:MAG: hypothetical protein DI535_00605 [Citrobacter freundii]